MVESGLPESRIVHDYILGKEVDREAWIGGLSQMYGMWSEFTDMIEWMRDYNQNAADSVKIKFYGIDITGSYTDLRPAFRQITDCLEKTDPVYTRKIQSELNPILDIICSNGFRKVPRSYRDSLNISQKYLLEEKFAELKEYISNNKDNIVAICGDEDYGWLRQNTISLLHTIMYYKNSTSKNKEYREYVGLNGRELAMMQNFQWIYASDPSAKIIILSHNIHTRTKASYFDDQFEFFTPFGGFIRNEFGNRYYNIGCAYDNGEYWDNWKKEEPRVIKQVPPSKQNEIDYTLKAINKPYYFINFKAISQQRPASLWLKSATMTREDADKFPITPDEFDGYIYYNTVSVPTENK